MKSQLITKSTIYLFFVIGALAVSGQQQSQFTQFQDVGLMFNPAYAGASGSLNVGVLGRWQWVGFEGAPNTQTAFVEGDVQGKNIGLGLVVSRDEVAITNFTFARLNYAYKIKMLGGSLAMGLSASLNNYASNFSEAFVVDPDANFQSNYSSFNPNFGLGLHFRRDEFWLGFAIPEIINNTLEQDGIEFYNISRHTYVSGGYRYQLNESIALESNLMLRFVAGSPLSADVNVMALYRERFGLGLAHRIDESFSLISQFGASDRLKVGYAFDYISNSDLNNLANTSHELLVTYTMPWGKEKSGNRNKDADNDGVIDKLDECPDLFGPVSHNGCPLPDADGDGIADVNDKCPNTVGGVETFGCPDTDADGIIDIEDACPDIAGSQENGGCPDTDRDGIFDHLDQCPEVAGLDKFNGCPDTDGDGVQDSEDLCLEVAGLLEKKGCPGLSDATKAILAQAIKGVQFESSKDVLKAESNAILDQLVIVMKENPSYKLRVSGYTDSSGGAAANLDLSKKRAAIVKQFMMEKGVDAGRISSFGYGASNPISDNETKEGRAQNRRVEFEIED